MDFQISLLVARESKVHDFWQNFVERHQMTVLIRFSQYTHKFCVGGFQKFLHHWNCKVICVYTVKIRLIQSFGGALQILPKIVNFALSRHQERNLKIRIHIMKYNINTVILILKLWRTDYPFDRSNWRKILRLKFSKSIHPSKIARAGPNF